MKTDDFETCNMFSLEQMVFALFFLIRLSVAKLLSSFTMFLCLSLYCTHCSVHIFLYSWNFSVDVRFLTMFLYQLCCLCTIQVCMVTHRKLRYVFSNVDIAKIYKCWEMELVRSVF